MRRWLLTTSLFVLGFSAPAPARADLILQAFDAPLVGGSWWQNFHLTSTDSFSKVGFALRLPGGNDYPGFRVPAVDFSTSWATPDWSEDLDMFLPGPFYGNVANASGPSTDDLKWRSHFRGNPGTRDFNMSLYVYDDLAAASPIEGMAAYWDSTLLEWSFGVDAVVTWEEFQAYQGVSVMPTPSATLLGALGLGFVGLIRRHRS